MSWIVSSDNIPTMQLNKYEKWYYQSSVISEIENKKALLEGGFYYHNHLFVNEPSSILDIMDGSYAVALLCGDYILCACDCICTRNIYYYQNKDFYCVSSSLCLLLSAVATRNQIVLDSAFLHTYLIYGNNQYQTPYRGVFKLPAGHCIKISDKIYVFPYIDFDAEFENAKKMVENKDKAEYAIKILKSHCASIAQKYKGGTVLTEISGGVDSSLIAGLLHEEAKKNSLCLNGYSYTYRNQTIGNELQFMKDVAKKNEICNHVISDLELDSFKILKQRNEAFPDMSILNSGLYYQTRNVVSKTDATVSGQGGDICIGDYYNAFSGEGNVLNLAYHDSMYCERFILKTLMAKYVSPVWFGNIIPYQLLNNKPCYPLWLTDKMKHVANYTLNQSFRIIRRNTKNYGMRMALFDYLEYSGLVSDDLLGYVCYFPYFTRDMVVFGTVYNDNYTTGDTYRRKIKSASRKYLPLSVYLRNGKSRMDAVSRQAFINNTKIYRDFVSESFLLKKLSISKNRVLNEMQKIEDGKNYDINYSLRLISLIIWYEDFRSKYPTE